MLIYSQLSSANTVYRYQDEQGRWHFSDKKPKHAHEEIQVLSREKQPERPQLAWQKGENNQRHLLAINPFYAPVEFEIWQGEQRLGAWVVAAREKEALKLDEEFITQWLDDYEYRYRLGAPISAGDGHPLQPPVPKLGKYRVSQGFKGRFSHQQAPNRYAVDIAMAISDQVHAAREGIVVGVKDDYHMGGTDNFFKDKANYITVLHDDNTYAVYAHILLGSALVKEGQRVELGQALANAGTSGYSTGPHLHFVLRLNDGENIRSIPFKFATPLGIVEPQKNMWLQVVNKPAE